MTARAGQPIQPAFPLRGKREIFEDPIRGLTETPCSVSLRNRNNFWSGRIRPFFFILDGRPGGPASGKEIGFMIHVVATIELAEGKRDDFLNRVRRLVPEVRAEKGCVEYGPAVDFPTGIKVQIPLRENVVVMLEKWDHLHSLEAHLTAPHMLRYREDVKGMVVRTQLQVLQPAL